MGTSIVFTQGNRPRKSHEPFVAVRSWNKTQLQLELYTVCNFSPSIHLHVIYVNVYLPFTSVCLCVHSLKQFMVPFVPQHFIAIDINICNLLKDNVTGSNRLLFKIIFLISIKSVIKIYICTDQNLYIC